MPRLRKNLLARSPIFAHRPEPGIEVIVEAKGSSRSPRHPQVSPRISPPTESQSFLDARPSCFNFNEQAARREIIDALRRLPVRFRR
jgi:hypothetical protein